MTDPKIVLLNDTDIGGQHFGCQRVMATIRENLSARGANVIGSVNVGMPWHKMPAAKALIAQADIVVINGEGTLHHGKKRGRWLLDAGAFAQSKGSKVALINALWQENPAEWAQIANSFDYISCRDSRSAAALAKAIGRDVTWFGDLSMCSGVIESNQPRDGVVFGCSVHNDVSRYLADLSHKMSDAVDILPITSQLKFMAPHLSGLRKTLRQLGIGFKHRRFLRAHPNAYFVSDEHAYVQRLLRAELSVTGRFHAVCLAVVTQTPFICVTSNSWKIEALMADIGMATDRILTRDQLTVERIVDGDWAFTQQEKALMSMAVTKWTDDARVMFDTVAALVIESPTI